MKASNKIVLGVVLASVAFAASIVVATRVMAGRAIRTEYAASRFDAGTGSGSDEMVQQGFYAQGFDEISTSGVWKIEITRGDTSSVELSYPESLADQIDVRVAHGTLIVGFKNSVRVGTPRVVPAAVIVLPALRDLQMSGATKATLAGFSEGRLDIEMSGGTVLVAQECTVEHLRINGSGASMIDMTSSRVRNASIELSGAGNMTIAMDGGKLEANLSGATRLVYSGEVSEQEIDTSGVSSVRRR